MTVAVFAASWLLRRMWQHYQAAETLEVRDRRWARMHRFGR